MPVLGYLNQLAANTAAGAGEDRGACVSGDGGVNATRRAVRSAADGSGGVAELINIGWSGHTLTGNLYCMGSAVPTSADVIMYLRADSNRALFRTRPSTAPSWLWRTRLPDGPR